MTFLEHELAETGAIHVWWGNTDSRYATADEALLSWEETARAGSLRFQRDKHRFLASHVGLRNVLSKYLGIAFAKIVFTREHCPTCGNASHGRPRIAIPTTQVQFSLSRSGSYWLVALAYGDRVGADIEELKDLYFHDFVDNVLTTEERIECSALNSCEQLSYFYRAWTRKEAVTKANGQGLSATFTALAVSPSNLGSVATKHAGDGAQGLWSVENLSLPNNLIGAVARQGCTTGKVLCSEIGQLRD